MGECKVWDYLSFFSYSSQLSGASILFLFCFVLFFDFSHPPLSQLFSHHYEGGVVSSGSQALLSLLGVLIHIWSPEIADGCYILAYWYGSGGDIPFHKDGKVWLFHFPKNLGPWHSSEWQNVLPAFLFSRPRIQALLFFIFILKWS